MRCGTKPERPKPTLAPNGTMLPVGRTDSVAAPVPCVSFRADVSLPASRARAALPGPRGAPHGPPQPQPALCVGPPRQPGRGSNTTATMQQTATQCENSH